MEKNWIHLNQYLDKLTTDRIAGCACLVFERDKEVFRCYKGMKDLETGESPDKDTLYRIYSLTKIYTAVAALQLVEAGKMNLSDPVSRYLPEFSELYRNHVAANGWNTVERVKEPLQIRHLLHMTSGISYSYDNDGPTMSQTRHAVEDFRSSRGNYTTAEYASVFAKIPLAFEPGTHFLYGAGYDVLAAVIEKVSGQRFGDYLSTHIWQVMGLQSTMFRLRDERDRKNLCSIYRFEPQTDGERAGSFIKCEDRDRYIQPGMNFEEGGGGILSTMDDYMSFLRMLNKGGRWKNEQILSASMVEVMRTNVLDPVQIAEFPIPGYGYGCGVRVRLESDGLGPAGEFGWYGMSGSYALADPVNHLCLLYMQQMIPGRDKEIHPMLRRYLYEDFLER